jgi:hypothetical protein
VGLKHCELLVDEGTPPGLSDAFSNLLCGDDADSGLQDTRLPVHRAGSASRCTSPSNEVEPITRGIFDPLFWDERADAIGTSHAEPKASRTAYVADK